MAQLSEVLSILKSQCPSPGGAPGRWWLKKVKMRFFKSCDTLTTIQLGETTQLTRVVSPLKMFGGHLQAR